MKDVYIAITIDQDWCHQSVLEETIDLFANLGIPLTVFVTDFTRLWKSQANIEWGVHPNFERNSTHGDSLETVIALASSSVPNCISWRSHSLFSSSRVLDLVEAMTDWRVENNLYLPKVTNLDFHIFPGTAISRVPVHWEDDLELSCLLLHI